jgi:twinkle protein
MEGREWVVGSINGEEGRSLKVCISGSKVGIWSDFATGQRGDLLDLWRMVRGLPDNKSALGEIKKYLNIKDPEFERTKRMEYRKPSLPSETGEPDWGSPVMRYLTEERKLTPEAIATYRMREVAQVGPWELWGKQEPWKGHWIVFPSFDMNGELRAIKYLHLERPNGKKQTIVEPGCKPLCFGWQAIKPDAREIVICEGEIDAASLWTYGWPAISVPFGGGKGDKQQWVNSDWEYLEAMDTIYLCMDSDKEGEAATEELVQRLGLYRCKIVRLPRKDANQCLQDGITKEEIDLCFAEAREVEPEELKRTTHYTQDVINEFYPPGGKPPGFDIPWEKVPFRFLRGEVTLVTGINGHGKSLAWGQVLLAGSMDGERVCIASMEMHPRKTLSRLIRQATGKKQPSRDEIQECLDMMYDKLWLFGLVGTAKVDRLLETFEYAFRRYGVKQFLIDSLMKCGIDEDDYNGQKVFMERLCDFAARTGAHIHLVAHPRKGDDEGMPVGKLDIKGSGAITDLAFNSFVIWRNKFKENIMRAVANGDSYKLPKGVKLEDVRKQPDSLLICDKSRNVEEAEGKYFLWYDKPSMQLIEKPNMQPQIFFKAGDLACPITEPNGDPSQSDKKGHHTENEGCPF